MNISPDGITVRFNTEPEELFLAEKSDKKSNTVRIIDHHEYQHLQKKLPLKIIIAHQHEIFLRTITHVYVSEMILGKYLAIFSWTNKNYHHPIPHENEKDLCAHTMSIDAGEPTIDDKFTAITISKGTLAILQSIAHGRSMDSVIRQFCEANLAVKRQEVGPL